MTSRKRNKGKERKARAAKLEAEKERESRALVRNTWILWARGMNIYGQSIEIEWCNHGISARSRESRNKSSDDRRTEEHVDFCCCCFFKDRI